MGIRDVNYDTANFYSALETLSYRVSSASLSTLPNENYIKMHSRNSVSLD